MIALAIVVAAPLALAALIWLPGRAGGAALAVSPLAALPALALALAGQPGDSLGLDWLLLGAGLRIDDVSIVFLAFGGAVWLVAGIYAVAYHRRDARARRVSSFFLAAMAGSFALTLAADVVTFYSAFALMTLAAFGLIIHEGTAAAARAGTVYLVLALIGEALLLAGFILAATASGTVELEAIPAGIAEGPWPTLTVALLIAGFGIKNGLLGLHVWLPLAHPVAPTPSSAVLSGVIIKAGLIGWLVMLPLGEAAVGWASTALVVLGIGAAFFAAGVGIWQRGLKTNLAYSSVSQMGIMTAVVGVALDAPALRPLAAAAISLYALHHALTKASLFLGAGVIERAEGRARSLVLALFALLAASLAAAPFTAGSVAKQQLKDVAGLASVAPGTIVDLLTLTGAATALLLGRAVLLAARGERLEPEGGQAGLRLPWLALSIAALAGAWAAPHLIGALAVLEGGPASLWTSLWPVLLGLGFLAGGKLLGSRRTREIEERVPAGDVLAAEVRAWRWLVGRAEGPVEAARSLGVRIGERAGRVASLAIGSLSALDRLEGGLERWRVAGISLIIVAIVVGASLL